MLREQNIEPIVIEYLNTPPDEKQLKHLLQLLKLKPRDLMRHKEEEYSALGLDNPELDDETLISAMAAHPKLIERPIVVHGNRAIIGRPPEKVLEILP